jgi:NAD-dependent deacetylase sirtuin 4
VNNSWRRSNYWLRSFHGYPKILAANPNILHTSIAKLQSTGRVRGLITQNVDGLHQVAGSTAVNLHGSLRQIVCLGCGIISDREDFQAELGEMNDLEPVYHAENHPLASNSRMNPDGDIEASNSGKEFIYPECKRYTCISQILAAEAL